ncbi:OmpH family outer membrane protein [Olleya sp. HaHaR_3_96]|uniref:OmpH family outer membrane protein n=1 Tax=Olleya sp. HaHaR_3_96 TaxID=2745560 RepID=UPI001C4F862B|nr:OmpH family outer membrane protein [Olleya sp. HaHaR_3_96]QXP58408.1 OmpH family outer membrane protein [Olleya sp. HaHaR_3_96]
MNKIKLLVFINTILISGIIICGLVIYLKPENEKQDDFAYVDRVKLFNQFNMTNDIKSIEEKKIQAIKKPMDSIYSIYQKLANKRSNKAKDLEIELSRRSLLLDQIQENYTNTLTQQIWERLHLYTSAYAEENKIKILFGSAENGNIMYAKKDIILTDSVLFFCNQKYEGYIK